MSLSLVPIFADIDYDATQISGFPPSQGAPYTPCAPIPGACPTNNPVPPFSAGDKLGVGTNDKILQYQFSNYQNSSICGVFLDGSFQTNCMLRSNKWAKNVLTHF